MSLIPTRASTPGFGLCVGDQGAQHSINCDVTRDKVDIGAELGEGEIVVSRCQDPFELLLLSILLI